MRFKTKKIQQVEGSHFFECSAVGAERARLHFNGCNGKEGNGKVKVGVSSSVHTMDSTVWLCSCASLYSDSVNISSLASCLC